MLRHAADMKNNTKLALYAGWVKTESPNTLQIVAKNVTALMRRRDWTQMQLHFKSGVSQRHVSNVMNAKSGVSIEILEAVAGAFGIPGYLLLVDELPVEMLDSKKIPLLIKRYLDSPKEGQDLLDSMAERESHHHTGRHKLLPFHKPSK